MNPSDPQSETVEATLESRSKPWWASKTILASGGAIIATVLGAYFKADIAADDVTSFITAIIAAGLSGMAIYGRIKAKTEIAPRAVRATPEEIARARGRGGLQKGYAILRLLVAIVLTIALLHFCVGCASVQKAARTTSKVPGAAVVFCAGVVSWPVAAWALWPEQEALLWPGYVATQYWRAVP